MGSNLTQSVLLQLAVLLLIQGGHQTDAVESELSSSIFGSSPGTVAAEMHESTKDTTEAIRLYGQIVDQGANQKAEPTCIDDVDNKETLRLLDENQDNLDVRQVLHRVQRGVLKNEEYIELILNNLAQIFKEPSERALCHVNKCLKKGVKDLDPNIEASPLHAEDYMDAYAPLPREEATDNERLRHPTHVEDYQVDYTPPPSKDATGKRRSRHLFLAKKHADDYTPQLHRAATGKRRTRLPSRGMPARFIRAKRRKSTKSFLVDTEDEWLKMFVIETKDPPDSEETK